MGVAYANSERRITTYLTAYVLIMVPAALTVYLSLEYSDQWPILRDIGSFVGGELIIYDQGAALESYAGIFRTGEIAAWHAATAAAFLIMLATRNPSLAFRIVAGLVVVALVGTIILTGRRKMLMALTIFVAAAVGAAGLLRTGGDPPDLDAAGARRGGVVRASPCWIPRSGLPSRTCISSAG